MIQTTFNMAMSISGVGQKVYTGIRSKLDAAEMFAIEHKVNMHKKTALLIYDGSTLMLIAKHKSADMEEVAVG